MTKLHLLGIDSMDTRNIQSILILYIELALDRIVAPIDGKQAID